MVDIDQLLTGLINELNGGDVEFFASPLAVAPPFHLLSGPLLPLRNKIFYGMDTSNIPKPYGRVVLDSGTTEASYGHGVAVDHATVQIDVFTTNLQQANQLLKAVADTVGNQVFNIDGQTMVHCIRRAFGVLVEGKETLQPVYHGFHLFECIVDA